MLAVDCSFSNSTIEKLIELGCDVNAQGIDGMTALHKSCWSEKPETFELLLRKGSKLDIADEDGDTGRNLAEQSKAFKPILDQVMGAEMAVSMSRS